MEDEQYYCMYCHKLTRALEGGMTCPFCNEYKGLIKITTEEAKAFL